MRAEYLELKRQCNMIADEIESEEQSKRGLGGVLPNGGAMEPA